MREKIKSYIEYQFRKNNSNDNVDNVVDEYFNYYNEFINDGIGEKDSYLKVIKKFDLKYRDGNKELFKNNVAESIMLLSIIFGVFSFVTLFFSQVTSIVLLCISISIYFVCSIYLYKEACKTKEVNKDIYEYANLLSRCFKNLKKCMCIWTFIINIYLSILVMIILFFLDVVHIDINILFLMEETITDIIKIYFIIFLVCAIILSFSFKCLYDFINDFYKSETGSYLKKSDFSMINFLYNVSSEKEVCYSKNIVLRVIQKIISNKFFVLFNCVSVFLYGLLYSGQISNYFSHSTTRMNVLDYLYDKNLIIYPFIGFVFVILCLFRRKLIVRLEMLYVMLVIVFSYVLTIISTNSLSDYSFYINSQTVIVFTYASIFFIITFINSLYMNYKLKKEV